jgi:16S rRNA (guanine966-N2)-methyltransferase
MRVIAGECGGLALVAPKGSQTRPTTDKVKGAIFAMLGDRGACGRVLDLFAGSGGLGIEALSRGADWCDLVDRAPDAVEAISKNLAHTKLASQARVHRSEVERFLMLVTEPYDLILCDPPYGLKELPAILARVAHPAVARDGATVVVEYGRRDEVPVVIGRLRRDRVRVHGDTAVAIYDVVDGPIPGGTE